ncbi:L-aminoadipate-semialdehyde dehydrogenase-phosphopantetheinyl transferase-like [Tropilaelaps mercedesae]|uniref:L-aminoadipate-semialdehyde dehydrogenase-phosphopantetheinyl transferase n=1 Tax=Tropilaelaps mercedesae TaxID=418985 RepID=A0A1V9X722_9ACAR|nr:L-aminoadipate-semialdehyde dehydrogenase-phosphopantetheinyl transferase-like [Tropilaelaps mercedesae]
MNCRVSVEPEHSDAGGIEERNTADSDRTSAARPRAMRHMKLAFNISSWRPTRDEWILANRLVQRDEAERISKFAFGRDAKASMAGRLIMRRCLAESLRCDNASLHLTRTAEGRPALASAVAGFDFNVSHNGDFAVVAAGPCSRIGVDVMRMRYDGGRRITDFFDLMRRQFTPAEWRFIESSPYEAQQVKRFYRLWTLKESYVKAVGVGLDLGLHRISFNICDELRLADRLGVTSTSVEVDGRPVAGWTFHECLLDEGHCVATAVMELASATPAAASCRPTADEEDRRTPPQTDTANVGCYVQVDFGQIVRGLDPRDELSQAELATLWEGFRVKDERPF